MICCISMVGGMDPNSKETTWIDFNIEGRDRVWKRSLRKSRTLSAITSSNLFQSKSTDIERLGDSE